jgi:hypothetical protein
VSLPSSGSSEAEGWVDGGCRPLAYLSAPVALLMRRIRKTGHIYEASVYCPAGMKPGQQRPLRAY